MDEIMIHKFRY